MSQDLGIREPEPARLSAEQIRFIANTTFVPRDLRGKLPEIMACIATGRELGLGDMESLRQIHIVEGKPTLSAQLMTKLVRARGHSIVGKAGSERAIVTGKRGDTGDEITVEWTMEDAERAGLRGKANWQRYPRQMLWARAVSELCRMLFPDVIGGVSYTAEEIEAVVEEANLDQATALPHVQIEKFVEEIVADEAGPEQTESTERSS
jgi:hypothetical protein